MAPRQVEGIEQLRELVGRELVPTDWMEMVVLADAEPPTETSEVRQDPHLRAAMARYLDELDPKAKQIGAVNTIVRTPEGKLVGYNTDGSGFLWSLTKPLLAGEAPLLPDPKGVETVMIGAGGAARAVAFYLAEAIGGARLVIANRNRAAAVSLADEVSRVYGNTSAIARTRWPRPSPRRDSS